MARTRRGSGRVECTLAAVMATERRSVSSSTRAPMPRNSSAMTMMSVMSGTSSMTQVSSVSRHAAIMGSTAFLAPGTR